MVKQTMTILLVGLICFSSVSGFFAVVCQGSDGHIAVELLDHNHCECPEPDTTGQDHLPALAAMDHQHCTDSPAVSDTVIAARKNIRPADDKADTQCLILKPVSIDASTASKCIDSLSDKSHSFYRPLHTIILLV
ncbi:MAG: hypothetical protein ABFD91_12070 [Anaerohalosphaeraceae bacterium]